MDVQKNAPNDIWPSGTALAALFAAANVGVVLINADFKVSHANPAALKWAGRTSRENLDLTPGDLFHCRQIEKQSDLRCGQGALCQQCPVRAAISEALRGNATRTPGILFEALSGETMARHYFDIATVPFEQAGEPFALLSLTNVTERKQAQESLRECEARLRGLSEIRGVFLWDTDANLRYSFLSDKVADVLGFSPGECLGQSLFSRVPADDAQDLQTQLDLALLYGESSLFCEHRMTRKDGGEIWVSSSIMFRFGENGDCAGIFGSSHDMTERKIMELALLDSEARFRAITSAAQDAIIMLDRNGVILFWNDAAERIFGWNEGEVIGRGIHLVLEPARLLDCAFRGLGPGEWTESAHGPSGLLEMDARRRSGETFPAELAVSAVQHRGQWCAVSLLRDITERKQAEEDIQEAIARAQALAVRAQMADTAKSEFLANMSHEIRTPMNGIIGMTTLLMDTALTGEQRQYTEVIRSSGESLLGIINDILDFSKIEAGRLEFERIEFDLHTFLAEFSEMMLFRTGEKGLQFAYHTAPEVPRKLTGDPGRLRQILLNLVSNAVKFTEQGEVALSVERVSFKDGRVLLRFVVRDTGIGIPEDRVHRLFQAFSQVDASTTRRYGGTGLGLAISQRLAEMMSGSIGVQSEPGQGSVFWFTATLECDDPEELSQPGPPLTGTRWLLVDSHRSSREFLALQLHAWGCHFEMAESWVELLSALELSSQNKRKRYDGIVLDAELMPGPEPMRNALALPADAGDTRWVLKAGPAHSQQVEQCQALGFSGVLYQPVVRPDLLRNCLISVLRGENAEAPGPHAMLDGTAMPRHAMRVLVAEDNFINQQVVQGLLERMGCQVFCVNNGEEAVAALKNMEYDIVLMDCQMPVMDGFDATILVRSLENPEQRVPIVALTANAMKGDRERCLEAGMDEYLSKPLRLSELSAMLSRYAPGMRPSAAAPPRKGPPSNDFDSDIFCFSAFTDRIGDSSTLATTILAAAQEHLPLLLVQFVETFNAGNIKDARRHAHTIKGMAANIEARALNRVAKRIEDAIVSDDHAAAEAMLPELSGCVDCFLAVLHERLDRV